MKLQRLTFLNINALYGHWTIDFDAYQGIFAILGATGAGKTTILDAICLAIYGATPRLEKISKSDNALMSLGTSECMAEVELSINNNHYRFYFSQKRARGKPDGALQDPVHQIQHYQNNQFVLISEKKSHSEKLASQLLGMDFTQFTRSVLLAQGGFSAFLQASSEKRGELLEKITGTAIYAKIGEKVYRTFKQKEEALNKQKTQLAHLNLTNTPSISQLRQSIDHLQQQKQNLDTQLSAIQEQKIQHQTYQSLLDEQAHCQTAIANVQQQLDDFLPNSKRLKDAQTHATLRPLYEQLLFLKQEQQKKEQDCLDLIQQQQVLAHEISNHHTTLTHLNKQLHQLTPFLALTHEQVAQLFVNIKTPLEHLFYKIHELKTTQQHIQTLRDKKDTYQQKILSISTQLQSQTQQCQTLHEILLQYALETHFIGDDMAQLVIHLQDRLNHITALIQQVEQFWQRHQLWQQQAITMATQHDDIINHQNQFNLAKQALDHAHNEQTAAQLAYKHAYDTYHLTQEIVRLSDYLHTLQDDTPCPLCGATNHPYTHNPPNQQERHTNAKIVFEHAKTTLTNAKLAFDEQEKAQLLLHNTINQKKSQLRQLTLDHQNSTTNLLDDWQLLSSSLTPFGLTIDFEQCNLTFFENGLQVLTQYKTSYQTAHQLAQKTYHEWHNATIQLTHQQDQHHALLTECQALDDQITHDNAHWKTLVQNLAPLFTTLNTSLDTTSQFLHQHYSALYQNSTTTPAHCEQLHQFFDACRHWSACYQIPFGQVSLSHFYAQYDHVYTKMTEFDTLCQTIKSTLYHALEQYQSTQKTHQLKQEQLSLCQKQYQTLTTQHSTQTQALSEQVAHIKMLDEQFYAQLATAFNHKTTHQETLLQAFLDAHLPNEQCDELAQTLHTLQTTLSQYQAKQNDLQQKYHKLCTKTPDIGNWQLDKLQQDFDTLNAQKEQLLSELGKENVLYAQAVINQDHQDTLIKHIAKAEQDLILYHRLNTLIGDHDGKKYRNIAQTLTLNALLDEANTVLCQLTDRYTLTASCNPKNVLGIEIIDHHQGNQLRQSKNLSGGESFMVSLALALGLSKMSSQNLAIDSLFLDEGFGTLDENALDIALSVLGKIQASGKMIGIISHIGLLKERISQQILVVKHTGARSKLVGMGISQKN